MLARGNKDANESIQQEEEGGIIPSGSTLQLQCSSNANVTITSDYSGGLRELSSSLLMIQKVTDADTATYGCTGSTDKTFVFIKACRNCVEVDSGTMAGLVIGDLLATFLIGVAVYCVSTPRKDRIHRGVDRQALIPNDALYSGIRQGDREEYNKLKYKSKE
ncbi:T-cell surface glycoprotein CD3 delta chain-like [Rhinoraja longicauda]